LLLGLNPFAIHAGQTVTLKVRLNKRGRRLLRRHHKLRVRVIVETISPTGKPLVRTTIVTLRAKKKHH
jgi:hypothetical protein